MRPASLSGLILCAGLLVSARPAGAGHAWIDDPTGRGVLQVAFRQTPTYQDLAETQAALSRMAAILCDATEGQVRIAQIRLLSSPASEDLAALWIHDADAASGGPYDATGADLHRLGAHMDVFSSSRLRADRLAHLVAHHAFGLGDEYDDQRRRGGPCGVGPSFEPSMLDEKNHSIMQGAGGMRCIEGPLLGQECLRDDECGGAACRPVLTSEFSIASNHDLVRGDGRACPTPSPVSRIRMNGILPSKAEPLGAFDGHDFLSARASSVWHQDIEVLGPAGRVPGLTLHFYLTHLSRLAWQLTVAADASEFGGPKGQLHELRAWSLLFNDDFSLAATRPDDLLFQLPPSGGKGPLEVAIDVGTRNPTRNPGQGYDGLQMVMAGTASVALTVDGVVGCSADWCASSWNEGTRRWELSEQSLLHHGLSDWQALTQNLPFLVAPSGSVVEEPPAVCQAAPEFINDVMGADQVVFVLDTSRSMGTRVDGRAGEVCANGADDDGDGETDEATCADSRLEYEKTAVRAFIAAASSRTMQVGLVAMHTDAEIISNLADAGGAHRAVLGAVLGSLGAEGDTALGTALEVAQEALLRDQRLGRARMVVLATDGVKNVGVDPGQEARKLDPLVYRVFTVGVGSAADELTLSAIAARRGGVAFHAARATAMPAIYAELGARESGSAPLLQRTPFELARAGEAGDRPIPAARDFEINVEERAKELVVFLGSRNDRIDDWRLYFELEAPDGTRYDDSGPQNHAEHGFVVVKISDPKPGRWLLHTMPGGRGVQRSEVLAYTTQQNADLYVEADPRLASVTRPVHIAARPSYLTDIEGDVALEGAVRRPDGTDAPIVLTRDPVTQAWGIDFDRFSGRGLYEVRVHLRVGEGARSALGEPIFPGPSRVLTRVVPFERTATASFFVADGPPPPCSLADCDDDGLPDRLEVGCQEDADGDGMWNRFDADSDNDEILDGEDGTGDADKDGVPNFCDPETTPDSLSYAIEAEEAAVAAACSPEPAASLDGLKASLSAVRRIVQVVRTHAGVPADVRADLVKKLEDVIALKKQAIVIGDVLPEFCRKYQARLQEALVIERELRVRVDPYLVR